MEQMGSGPIRMPAKVAWTGPGARVLADGGPTAGPVLLIVPAPIKRAYI